MFQVTFYFSYLGFKVGFQVRFYFRCHRSQVSILRQTFFFSFCRLGATLVWLIGVMVPVFGFHFSYQKTLF